jgi:hypothetical protein
MGTTYSRLILASWERRWEKMRVWELMLRDEDTGDKEGTTRRLLSLDEEGLLGRPFYPCVTK